MKQNKPSFGNGIQCYSEALGFMFKHNLWHYFFYPLILNIGLFFIGFQLIDMLSENLNSWIADYFGAKGENLSWFKSALNSLLYWAIWITTKIIFFIVFPFIGGYFTIIILSPILAYLSERTAGIITGKEFPFDILQITRDVVRAVLIALRNMMLQLLFVIGFFILSFIPVIGWIISAVGNFFAAAYFYGYAFIDYTNERNRLSVRDSSKFVRKNMWFAIGLGSIFALCYLIPFIGSIIASFVCVVAVVGTTIQLEKRNLKID